MAADLVMPTLPGDQHFSHIFPERPHHTRAHSYHVQPGPQISPLSTEEQNCQNASTPASPRSSYQSRHVRPLYIPAVLRPNEFPVKRIATKCKTPDGAGTPDSGSETDYTLRRSSSSFVGMTGLGVLSQRLARRPNGDRDRNLDGDWDLELFPPVTALPTKDHWKVCRVLAPHPICLRRVTDSATAIA